MIEITLKVRAWEKFEDLPYYRDIPSMAVLLENSKVSWAVSIRYD
jgi:hypothetical protein